MIRDIPANRREHQHSNTPTARSGDAPPITNAVCLDSFEQQKLLLGRPVLMECGESDIVDHLIIVAVLVWADLVTRGKAVDAQIEVGALSALDSRHPRDVLHARAMQTRSKRGIRSPNRAQDGEREGAHL